MFSTYLPIYYPSINPSNCVCVCMIENWCHEHDIDWYHTFAMECQMGKCLIHYACQARHLFSYNNRRLVKVNEMKLRIFSSQPLFWVFLSSIRERCHENAKLYRNFINFLLFVHITEHLYSIHYTRKKIMCSLSFDSLYFIFPLLLLVFLGLLALVWRADCFFLQLYVVFYFLDDLPYNLLVHNNYDGGGAVSVAESFRVQPTIDYTATYASV